MSAYMHLQEMLAAKPRQWLVTGVAGFIGSNLLEALLRLNQTVVGLDNFSTGTAFNLEQVRRLVHASQWSRFRLVEGDIRDRSLCGSLCAGVDVVLHQAALGSVPRSVADPWASHDNNVNGFLSILLAVREARVRRLVYASSSSVYGDSEPLPQVEDRTGRPLSPYAATKAIDEVYARAFAKAYGVSAIGLRYFNVYGPRQAPEGPYAAVIPRWAIALLTGGQVEINGDGQTSRDFCFVANVVQANLLAAMTDDTRAVNQEYNVAVGERTTLLDLFGALRDLFAQRGECLATCAPIFKPFRPGDIRDRKSVV
jgi:UDP-N-acetylglucosamine/UDP-N-acetylgalactosamine 4-epimerase